jgi:hypothetical protein
MPLRSDVRTWSNNYFKISAVSSTKLWSLFALIRGTNIIMPVYSDELGPFA